MPVYPASMSALPQPMLVPARWQPLRVVAAVLCFVAMVLVLSALFVPLYSGELSFDAALGPQDSIEITYTPWDVEYDDPSFDAAAPDVPQVGYPIVFAVVALAVAACACWYAATPSAGRTAARTAGVVTAVAGAFVIGTVWTTALLVMNAIDGILLYGTASPGVSTEATYLVGYWLLLVATLLGFAAAVLALLPARQAAWRPAGAPYGLPGAAVAYAVDATTGQRLPGPPVAPYASVDPLTGEPVHPAAAAQRNGHPTTRPPTIDPWTGQPGPPAGATNPWTAQPAAPGPAPAAIDPWTGQPVAGVDPLTGQPSPPSGLPAVAGPAVDPLTGQPLPPGAVPAPAGAADPWTAQPASVTGQSSPPAGFPAVQPTAVDPLTGQAVPQALPFTPDPVPPGNGTDPPPIQLPDPPAPEPPRGPAVPASEDPLAEPPKS